MGLTLAICPFPPWSAAPCFSFSVSFSSPPLLLCAALLLQACCQDAASLCWRSLKDWASQAPWGRTWRWWSKECTPFPCLTCRPCQSSEPGVHPDLLHCLLQKKPEPGTVAIAHKGPSGVFHSLANCGKTNHFFIGSKGTLCLILNRFTCVNKWHAALLGLRPRKLLLGGTFCIWAVGLLFAAPEPSKCSHCLQAYGIVWQRTQTFSNWLQPLCELLRPILRKDNMMFPQCFAPAGLCYIHARSNSTEYNSFAGDQSLGR